jgi:hypothetical protein
MRTEALFTRLCRLILAITVALTALLAPVAPVAHAQTEVEQAGTLGSAETLDPSIDIDRWWGVVGAALCGAEMRLVRVAPAIGMNPYAIAGGLAGCLLAGLDIMTTQ